MTRVPNRFAGTDTRSAAQLMENFDAITNPPSGTLGIDGSITATNDIQVQGASTARFSLLDSAAGVGVKRSRLRTILGKTRLDTMSDDDLSTLLTMLSADHATGIVDFPHGISQLGTASPYFRAYRGSAASYATGAYVLFDNETDPNGWYDPATGKFQPTVPGRYRIHWQVEAQGVLTAGKVWITTADLNGASLGVGEKSFQVGATYSPNSSGSVDVSLNGSSDYVQIRLTHDVGSNVFVQAFSANTYFEASRIGA